jgi:hypothetical protein
VTRRRLAAAGACLAVAATVWVGSTGMTAEPTGSAAAAAGTVSPRADLTVGVPEVLQGDRWLRHLREDLMPYWDMPEALGVPVGNFPSFRGRSGELLADERRGLSTLARGVYGYSLAFMLTGEERYLTYAKAGLDWINTKAKDPVYGGYFGQLRADGEPVNRTADKDVFGLASLGLAYGMYYNATRDPAAEAELLAVRDLLFDKYYDAANNRVKDSLTYDLSTEVDTAGDGGDITNLLVPATAIYLPNMALLSDPARRAQFAGDLRNLTQSLIDRHKDPTESNRWWFWGRTGLVGNGFYNSLQTDYGHNIKSYEMIYNAGRRFADRPWSTLSEDRTKLLGQAWDLDARRWNHQRAGARGLLVERDSAWWMHDEADQTLAALDLDPENRFAHTDQLAQSAQTFLDVYVDRDPAYPVRETFARVERTGTRTNLQKSHFGKNMLHNHEHALIMYLHGRALEGLPARLYYALPDDQALTAVAKPYWFDAAGQSRTVGAPLADLPGHRLVEVEFTGLDAVEPEPYPAPADSTAPTTTASVSPEATEFGWHREDVGVSLSAVDDRAGVKEIHALIQERDQAVPDRAWIDPGADFTLPPITVEGEYTLTYYAVDALGHSEEPHTLVVRLDKTEPSLSGLPAEPCTLWPPDRQLYVVADVTGSDERSGVADLHVTGSSDEADPTADDIVIDDGRVRLRAERDSHGDGRTYTLHASVTDRAGNTRTGTATCHVPHDQGE